MRLIAAFAGAMDLAQAAAESFDLLLVSGLLPLGQFQGLHDLLHVLGRSAESLDDPVYLLDRLLDGHRCGRMTLAGRLRWGRVVVDRGVMGRSVVMHRGMPLRPRVGPQFAELPGGRFNLGAGNFRILRFGRHR